MSQSSNTVNKQHERGRVSSTSMDENIHSINTGVSLSLQSFVDDIPFEFNPKYRTVFVSNIDIPDYDTRQIRDILARPIDLTLENKVLLGALEDLQRKMKVIEADTSRQQSLPPSTNCQLSDSTSVSTNIRPEHKPFSVNHPVIAPTITVLSSSHPNISPLGGNIPVSGVSPPSFRLPSVRDIYWPSGNQQQYTIPPVNNPPIYPSNILNLPTPINSSQSSPNSVKENNRSFNNCSSMYTNDLAATFDGRMTSDDPFNDTELKCLNDVTELNQLYSNIGSANTLRR